MYIQRLYTHIVYILPILFCAIKSHGQFSDLRFDITSLRPGHLLIEQDDRGLTSFTTANHVQMTNGEILGTLGGDDVVLSHWDDKFNITDFLSFGSAFQDEANFLVADQEELIVGLTFWDELQLNDATYTAPIPGKAVLFARFTSNFDLLSKVILSSSTTVRCGEGIRLSNGHLLTSGWFVDDLYVDETPVVQNDKGVFLFEWDADFQLIRANFWTVTGRVDDAQLVSYSNALYTAITFEDSLFVEDATLVTRRATVTNTAVIKLNQSLQSEQALLIKSTFDNVALIDRGKQNNSLRLAINFRGNLEVRDEKIEGLPMTDQSVLLDLDEVLQVSSVHYLQSKTGARFSGVLSSDHLIGLGSGVFDTWQVAPPDGQSWVVLDPHNESPIFLDMVADELLVDDVFSSDSTVYITGVFRGQLEIKEHAIFFMEEQYQPFVLRLRSASPSTPTNSVLKVTPNPIRTHIQLSPANPDDRFRIWNADGKLILQGRYGLGLYVPLLLPGIYFIELKSDGQRRHARFMKIDGLE